MVFIGGPRQAGKTTVAKNLLETHFSNNGLYLNWDNPTHRKLILSQSWQAHQKLIVLDELHKYRRWKNWLKGTPMLQNPTPQITIKLRHHVTRNPDISLRVITDNARPMPRNRLVHA